MLLLAAIYLCHLYGSFFFSFQKRALFPIFKRRISLQMTGYSSWVRFTCKVMGSNPGYLLKPLLLYHPLQVQINCWQFHHLFNWAFVQLEITTLCWLSLWLQSKYDCSLMIGPEQPVVDFNPGIMMSKHARKWETKVQNVLFSYLKEK